METDLFENCPCGSGKKFSECHGQDDINDDNDTDDFSVDPEAINNFLKSFDQTQLLAVSAALQLNEKNHGKNIRLEEFTDDILRQGIKSDQRATYEDIQEFFEKHLRFDSMEDPTVNHFIENVVFYGGNYRVLPGINTDATEILNGFLESIFTVPNGLSEAFKEKARQASFLLLLFSEIMISQTGLPRYTIEEEADDPVFVPEFDPFNKLLSAVRLEKNYIEKLCKDWQIPPEIIKEFLINGKDLGESHDPYESPIFSYPLYDAGDEIICIIPATLSKALSDFIKRLSGETGEEKNLLVAYHDWQWQKFRHYADEMGWSETDITLPPAVSPERFTEGVFRIDQDKLAYVQLIRGTINSAPNVEFMKPADSSAKKQETINERNEVVARYLNELKEGQPMKVVTLFIAGGIGGHAMYAWPKPEEGNQTLFFSFSDFEKVIFQGALEPLSLWKFAKAYGRAAQTTRFMPSASSLDLYVLYLENQGSMLPRDENFDLFTFMGVGTDFQRRVVSFRDEHAARRYSGSKPIDVPVRRGSKYAPIYRQQQTTPESVRLIEPFVFPCWIVNKQAHNKPEHGQIGFYTEAVAFWLLKFSDTLKSSLNELGSRPVEITLELDNGLYTNLSVADWPEDILPELLEFTVEDRVITIEVPLTIVPSLAEDHNKGERTIMRTVLKAFNVLLKKNKQNVLTDEDIEQKINEVMSPDHAKMILIGNSDQNPILDTRGTGFRRHLYEADQALVDDYLIPNLGLAEPIPDVVKTIKEKNKLCMAIVDSLISQIREKIAGFNLYSLIKWLITINESLIQEDAENDMRLPHQVACYSDFPTAVADLQKKNGEIIPTALACRCLIEFIAAEPLSGQRPINLDEMDELIALMSEVIHYANIADSIALGLNDPEMGLLPSGRLYVSHEFFETYLKPFNLARTESEVHAMLQTEECGTIENDGNILVNNKTTDNAFFEEWGVTLTTLTAICGNLIKMGMATGESFMIMVEEKFMLEIGKDFVTPVSEEELLKGLQLLTLEKRESLDKAPDGFTNKDIMPWRFNRALSYNRRPLIKIVHPDNGQTFYHWGFRHVLKAYDNLSSLITSGRLVVKEGGPIEKEVLTIFRHRKGKRYRQQVVTWLKAKTKLETIDYEVTLHETGVLVADRNYGDVDVMAIDHDKKIIYAIECKNTVSARAIHEMKTELDNYIGKDGKSGHISKHLNRDTWLKANKNQLSKFVKDPENYEIRSIVLTSNVIPVLYLAKTKSALPIFSFPDLVRKGFDIIAKDGSSE
ncbi:SEC-C domain-containing protein [Mucilaginibacter sp. SMC90]|uniref:SEC-C domain-containing protein n=1 Tax=Mucilaginibacter sp. SMC90 TaxID=2929803 RepID=UPI001FB233D2|nr:SEC-C domain-containing protein [Mucilaginibacter sp. SMC90]UOE52613.1 SEC-C domain-containing protein [Mucilaginibacter sp. SMC90]